jgi:hypothetical protein
MLHYAERNQGEEVVVAGMKVVVTEEIAERACQRDSQHCMIAEAIKEAHPEFHHILVDLQTIRWTDPNARGGPKRVVCFTPRAAAQALISFDRGEPVGGFEFTANYLQRTPAREGTRGRRKFGKHEGQLVIEGGTPVPTAHLRGSSESGRSTPGNRKRRDATAAERQRKVEVGELSNVEASSTRFRQYGLRLLRD